MKNKTRTILTAVLILVAVLMAGVAGALIYQKKQAEDERRAAYEKLMAVELNNPDMPEEEYRSYKSENPDVYAWLDMGDVGISCPIVQSSEDNAWYLSHDAYGAESEAGAVFTENYNSLTFDDPETVIYGSSTVDGSAFAPLLEYEDPVYFENHREFQVYLPDQTLKYRIFATYVGDDAHLLLNGDLNDRDVFTRFIKEILRERGLKTNVDREMELTADNRLLTLSTSHPSSDSARYLVHAVRID